MKRINIFKITIPVSVLLFVALLCSGAFASSPAYPEQSEIDSFVLSDTTSDSTMEGYAEQVATNAIKAHEDWFTDIIKFNFEDGSSIESNVFYYKADNSRGYEGYYLFERGAVGGGIDKVITDFCPHQSPVTISALKDCTKDYSIQKRLISTEVVFSHVPGDGKLPNIGNSNSSTETEANTSKCSGGDCPKSDVKENNTPTDKEGVKTVVVNGLSDTKEKALSKDVLSLNSEESSTSSSDIDNMSYDERVNTLVKYLKSGDMTEAGFVDAVHTYMPKDDFKFE